MKEQHSLEQEYLASQLDIINESLSNGLYVNVRNMLHDMQPADIALLLESTPSKNRNLLWGIIDTDCHGDILEELSEEVRNGIIHEMMPETLADALENMETDNIAEILHELPERVVHNVLESMDSMDRVRAEQALAYGEGTAGFIMNTDAVTLRPEVSLEVIFRYLRLKKTLPKDTDTLYVTNRHDELIGSVALTCLITSPPEVKVEEPHG